MHKMLFMFSIQFVAPVGKGGVPCCAFSVKWIRSKEQPVKLVHRMKLLGAKEPANLVTLEIDPPGTPASHYF